MILSQSKTNNTTCNIVKRVPDMKAILLDIIREPRHKEKIPA